MWKFTLRVGYNVYKKNKCFVHQKIQLLTLYFKYKCSWVRGMHMVTYNICETIFEIKVFTQSINK